MGILLSILNQNRLPAISAKQLRFCDNLTAVTTQVDTGLPVALNTGLSHCGAHRVLLSLSSSGSISDGIVGRPSA